VAIFTAGVVDTGGKFTTVVDLIPFKNLRDNLLTGEGGAVVVH